MGSGSTNGYMRRRFRYDDGGAGLLASGLADPATGPEPGNAYENQGQGSGPLKGLVR